MSAMRWVPFGPTAALVEMDAEQARLLASDRRLAGRLGIREVTPSAARTLVEFRDGAHRDRGMAELEDALLSRVESRLPPARLLKIPVCYGGEDFEEALLHTGFGREEWIERHTRPEYRVAMLGFAPGFAYLSGTDPRLHMPRRETPRPRIEAGSVAVGGPYTGIYSIPTPGGWNLVGTTRHVLFDPSADDASAFRLHFGDRVVFLGVES